MANYCRAVTKSPRGTLVYIFLFDFLHIDLTNNFRLCKFFDKSSKSEGEMLEVKLWPLEMMKKWKGKTVLLS